jgi:formylglycine-generating enzyme required for sulfatase activity
MHLNSLRVPFLVFASLAILVSPNCRAQNIAKQGSASPAPAASNQPATKASSTNLDLTGLPTFLIPVPGGPVDLGLEAAQFIAAACQSISPEKPESAPKTGAENLKKAMNRSASVLGRRRVEVPTFLLAKFPVTNAQYARLVEARRKAGIKMRAPFHWWRFGCKDDYESKLEDIGKAFPKVEKAEVKFWELHGAELPFKLLDEKGRAIDDQPVVFVTWREANDFAGSIGMRLPMESEWTRAARGDGKQIWPVLKPEQGYTEELLKMLRMTATADKITKPVGTTANAAGPFGHADMFGQVWQYVGNVGYHPINGRDAFAAEWKTLQKDKTGQLVPNQPPWGDDKVVAKGGSWFSANEPIQLLIDARAPMTTDDEMESLGFRLAKSLKPGYDALFSALRGLFSCNLASEQSVDLANQIGAERYELDATGFPTSFETVTFAPVNFLGHEKNGDLAKLVDKSEWAPMPIGVLLTTNKMAEPAVDAGLFSVYWRHEGVPRELTDAVKQGAKDLAAAAKKGDVKPEEKEKKAGWREVIAKVGLTEKDLEGKDAADGIVKFVRVDTLEVPTDADRFVLFDQLGKPVASWKAGAKPVAGNAAPSTLVLGASSGNKMTVQIHADVPINQGNQKRVAEFQLEITLDREPSSADKPWRLPATK